MTWEAWDCGNSLVAGQMHVWRAYWPQWLPQWVPLQATLSADEQARAARFRQPGDRHRYTLARAILRDILGRYLNRPPAQIQFAYSDRGKPFVAGAGLEFNVSHSEDWAVYGIARDPVGVDVEAIRPMPQLDGILQRYFAPSEQQALQGLPEVDRQRAFFRCWTGKEAFLKATGLGLSHGLEAVAIAPDPFQFTALPAPAALADWRLLSLEVAEGYAAAVAIAHSAPVVSCYDWFPAADATVSANP